jgi:hypothetical protein
MELLPLCTYLSTGWLIQCTSNLIYSIFVVGIGFSLDTCEPFCELGWEIEVLGRLEIKANGVIFCYHNRRTSLRKTFLITKKTKLLDFVPPFRDGGNIHLHSRFVAQAWDQIGGLWTRQLGPTWIPPRIIIFCALEP